jgi:hypothetical protein
MTAEVKSNATKPKKKKRLEPTVRLAMRFMVLCYQHFEILNRRGINLNLTGYTAYMRYQTKAGTLASDLPVTLWRVLASRSRRAQKDCPIWPVAEAQAARFIEENRELIAEQELST